MPIYEGLGAISDKLTLVLDIGTAYTKIGFSGEFAPRCIIPSEVRCKETGRLRKICDYKDRQDLYDLLVDFVHVLYFKYALISPKDRPVVIVESLLCPTVFRETLAKVLFYHYSISSLLIVPSHLVSLAPLAIDTALVLDVGYAEAIAIPICHGSPVLHAWQALPLASQIVHSNIKTLLSQDNMGVQNITDSTLEDIKVRCCFVTKRERGEKLALSSSDIKPCPDVKYPLGGSKMLTISGKLRETAYEVFFEEDNDHQCLATMILDAILMVDMDSRVLMAENILLIGGTAMAPGFKARLREELYKQLKNERYAKFKNVKVFKFHSSPCKDNYTAWLGASIYGATEVVSMKALTRDQYFTENRLPDWQNLKDNARTKNMNNKFFYV